MFDIGASYSKQAFDIHETKASLLFAVMTKKSFKVVTVALSILSRYFCKIIPF